VEVAEVFVNTASGIYQLVPIPFGIFVIDTDTVTSGSPGRYRIDPPVNKDAELGILKPLWNRPFIK